MHISRILLATDLQHHISALGSDRDQMSVSIYDTAQVLRLAPQQPQFLWPALEWLVAQQQEDGGWNALSMNERERTAPTLAATLVLHRYATRHQMHDALLRGIRWLQRSLPAWAEPLPDDLPVGVELVVPYLVTAAREAGLAVPIAYSERLAPIRERRLAQMFALPPRVLRASRAMHSWEAWGDDPLFVHPQAHIGVCASPAATAAWLALAEQRADVPDEDRAAALAYLERASVATSNTLRGLYPTAWPISHFETAYALHSVVQSGVHRHINLDSIVAPQLDTLTRLLQAGGVGATAGFPADGDDTAAAIGALVGFGRRPSLDALRQFLNDDHAVSYVGELQPSVITTARAVQALNVQGEPTPALTAWLAQRQEVHGLWPADKWNADRRYVAAQAMLALAGSPEYGAALVKARDGLLAFQHDDGGWGQGGHSQMESTAYAVMALRALPVDLADERVAGALTRAMRWMAWHYRPFAHSEERHWLAKDRYRPHRLSRIIELTSLLALVIDNESDSDS
jgi:hypothetical protein